MKNQALSVVCVRNKTRRGMRRVLSSCSKDIRPSVRRHTETNRDDHHFILSDNITNRWQLRKILFSEMPIRQIPKCVDIFWTCITIINIVSMLPYITSQQRYRSASDQRSGIASTNNFKLPVLRFN